MKRVPLCILCPILAAAVTALMLALTVAPQRVVAQDAAVQEEAAASNEDLLKIPDGDAGEIIKFMYKLGRTQPEGDSEEEFKANATKMLQTIVDASDRVLAAKPTDKQAGEAFQFKLSALEQLAQLDPEGEAPKLFAETMEAARADKRDEVAAAGWQSFISGTLSAWNPADKAAKEAFLKEVLGKVEADGPQPMDVSIVNAIAGSLDQGDNEFVKSMLEAANPVFEKSQDKDVQAAFAESNLAGFLRRLNLPGQPIEISGKLLDGTELDWESYRGKVVLVDFWATWCGPCRDEVPNVLENYRAYHDKGFEVVGVSLDQTKEAAMKYVESENIPWPSIFPEKKEDRYWNHPLVKYYGVPGIPLAILVNKDGKVVHMNARGEALGEELQKLLGEPVAPPQEAQPAAKTE